MTEQSSEGSIEEVEELDTAEGPVEIPEAELTQVDEEALEDDTLEERRPEIAAELAEDPVRLYLREIGEVKLLDSDSEFRLATLIEANRQIGAFLHRPARKGTLADGGRLSQPAVRTRHVVESFWRGCETPQQRIARSVPDAGRGSIAARRLGIQ